MLKRNVSHSWVCSRMSHEGGGMLVGRCKLINSVRNWLISKSKKVKQKLVQVWHLFSQPLNPFSHLCKIIISLPSLNISDNDLRASLIKECPKGVISWQLWKGLFSIFVFFEIMIVYGQAVTQLYSCVSLNHRVGGSIPGPAVHML